MAKIVAIYLFFSAKIENFENLTSVKHLTNSKSGGVHAFFKLKTDDDDDEDEDGDGDYDDGDDEDEDGDDDYDDDEDRQVDRLKSPFCSDCMKHHPISHGRHQTEAI